MMLLHRVDKMKLTDDGGGCNFNCAHPHYWWMYEFRGINSKYVNFAFLCWTVAPGDITCKLSEDGSILYVGTKIPERFANFVVMRNYYAASPNAPDEGDVMLEAFRKTINMINEMHGHDPIKPLTTIKLPFPVQQTFHDPYFPDQNGYALRTYNHETAMRPQRMAANPGDPLPALERETFHVFYVGMQGKDRGRSQTRVGVGHIDIPDADFE